MRRFLQCVVALTLTASATMPALAWTRPGHMVTAAIAFDEIARDHPEILATLERLLDAHPDRGPFQVAIDRTTGHERIRRMFLECARWPDDVRETHHDHPGWHAALSNVHRPDRGSSADETPTGQAFEAFALSFKQLSDTTASPGERAVALCWVLHLAGDIHQPLHTAQLVSKDFPGGDRGGGLQYVIDPLSAEPISLHWLWDDSVHRSGDVASVNRKAAELTARFPRTRLEELHTTTLASQFPEWARRESYPLAASMAYGGAIPAGMTPKTAVPVSAEAWRELQKVTARRATLAGYRMADLMVLALAAATQ